MIKIENYEVVGWEAAIRGMRNPMNSWENSDTDFCECDYACGDGSLLVYPNIGESDLSLMKKLRDAGTDHRKFMRMITVYIDITAPLYWWKEFDTYKIGTVANSCSTMHKIAAKEFTLEDFSHEHLLPASIENLEETIETLNEARDLYLGNAHFKEKYKDTNMLVPDKKVIWWQMIQLLPSSYNQKRTIMLNYEVLANIYKSRKNHKLDEWHTFCDWIEKLPVSKLIIGE